MQFVNVTLYETKSRRAHVYGPTYAPIPYIWVQYGEIYVACKQPVCVYSINVQCGVFIDGCSRNSNGRDPLHSRELLTLGFGCFWDAADAAPRSLEFALDQAANGKPTGFRTRWSAGRRSAHGRVKNSADDGADGRYVNEGQASSAPRCRDWP